MGKMFPTQFYEVKYDFFLQEQAAALAAAEEFRFRLLADGLSLSIRRRQFS